MKLMEILLALFLPPVAVAMKVGITKQFWINLVLTMFWFLPGILHAFWVLSNNPTTIR